MIEFSPIKSISVKQLEEAGFTIKYHGLDKYYSLAKDNNEVVITLDNDILNTLGSREIHNSIQIIQDICKTFDTDVISDEFPYAEELCYEAHTKEDCDAIYDKYAKLTMQQYNLTR